MSRTCQICCLLWCCFGVLQVNAQNFLLQNYHPKNTEGKRLRTDSMHIRTFDGSGKFALRNVRYDYDDKNLLIGVKERHYDSLNNIEKILIKKISNTNNILLVDEVALNPKGDILIHEQIVETRRVNDNQVDSIEYFIYDNGILNKSQKTKCAYDKRGNLSSLLEFRWDKQRSIWIPIWREIREYDGKGNLTLRQYVKWDEAEQNWRPYNEYSYEYSNGGTKHIATIWRNEQNGKMLNVEKTEFSSKINEKKDTIFYFHWNSPDSIWIKHSFMVLSADEHQQRFEIGDLYIMSSDGIWEKREETAYSSGDGLYSDEAEISMTQQYDKVNKKWSGKHLEKVQYLDLPDGKKVQGHLEIQKNNNEKWEHILLVDAWFTKQDPERNGDGVQDRTKVSDIKSCGIPNPYVINSSVMFSNDIPVVGSFELRVTSEDGRLVWHKEASTSHLSIDANLLPGLYVASVIKEGKFLCTQKLLVKE